MPAIELAEHAVESTPYGRWQRLNGALAIEAFGLNAIVCEPGETIDIEHSEEESGQQEAYIVVSGRAAFRIGDDEVEARPGTVVSAPEPAVTRSYRALEPGTRIVCIGAATVGARRPGYGDWISEAATAHDA